MPHFFSRIVAFVVIALGLGGCVCTPKRLSPVELPAPSAHPLVGAWEATDKTVFIFRGDGTLIGADWRGRELWGNWVRLDASRIGFQSLLHDSFYRPQYAVIRAAEPDAMDYIVTGGVHFIAARRITVKQAEEAIARVRDGTVVWPKPASAAVP